MSFVKACGRRLASPQTRTWLVHGAAIGAIVVQAMVTQHFLPMGDRFFLHPDDRAALVYTREIREHGLPYIPANRIALSNISIYPVFAPTGSRLNPSGQVVTPAAPGLFYLLAVTPASVSALRWNYQVLCSLSFLSFYVLALRYLGRSSALLALIAFAFSPHVLFWSAFVMSNIPGIGVLCLAMTLAGSASRIKTALGMFLLIIVPLFRFEFLPISAMVIAGRVWTRRKVGVRQWRTLLWMLPALCVGIVLLLGISRALYGTANFVAFSRGSGSSAQETVSAVVSNTSVSQFELKYQAYSWFTMFYFTLVPWWFLRRKIDSTMVCFALAVLALSVYFLFAGFDAQSFLMSTSQTRYLIPLVACGSLALGALVADAKRWIRAIPIAATAFAILSGAIFVQGPAGFQAAGDLGNLFREDSAAAASLPSNVIIVGDQQSKWLTDRIVLAPAAIPVSERPSEVHRIVVVLLEQGREVYMSKGPVGIGFRDQLLSAKDLHFAESATPSYWRIELVV